MSVFGTNEELNERIGGELKKLKSQSLTHVELDKLVADSRELYERLVVLRYKAFEQAVKKEVVVPDEVQVNAPQDERVEPDVVELHETTLDDEQEVGFSFQLFDELVPMEEDGAVPPAEENKTHEVVSEEPTRIAETAQPEVVIGEQPVSKSNAFSPATSLLEKLSEQHNQNRLSDRLKLSPVSSLKTTFTLNDRIRFSQGLFSGDSDQFRQAVEFLDNCTSLSVAKAQLVSYAELHKWDMESKDVEHFYEFIERRFMA